jgi:hypothetical protein
MNHDRFDYLGLLFVATSIRPKIPTQEPSAITKMPPCLQALPDELLLLIMNNIRDSKRLHPFLLSRQFHGIALEALYFEIHHAVFDPTLSSSIVAPTVHNRRMTLSTSILN